MPSSAALAFIFSTKAASLPARYSAMATEASLPEATAMALSISSTDSSSPSSRNTWEPPMPAALAETGTMASLVRRPLSRASSMSRRVMTLVTLAGSRGSWAFSS